MPRWKRPTHRPSNLHGEMLLDWLLMHLHPVPEPNQNAITAGWLCSRCLDDWGVQLQRAGELDKAARRFTEAIRLNPDNRAAEVNLAFNQATKARTPDAGRPCRPEPRDQFGKYRNWNAVVTANGRISTTSLSVTWLDIRIIRAAISGKGAAMATCARPPARPGQS